MKTTIFLGDLAEAPAEALCTSTNPRLSLAMGTGAAVRGRAGYEVLRECEAIVAKAGQRLPAGSVHVTSAGALPAKMLIHCVASDDAHRSSAEIIRSCVINALARADERRCSSMALPVFATGHAHFNFLAALRVIGDALQSAKTSVEHVYIVINDREHLADARRAFPRADLIEGEMEESESYWQSE